MKNLILIPILFLRLTLSAQYIVVKPSQLPAATTINPTDLLILNQGTTTKKVTYTILNTVLKDTFPTLKALADSCDSIRADIVIGEPLHDYTQYDTIPTIPTLKAGTTYWNETAGTFDDVLKNGVILQRGQEMPIKVQNNTGSLIANGKAAYVLNAGGEIERIAIADNRYIETAYKFIGLTTSSIPHGSTGYVTISGKVHGLNTAGFIEGSPVYLTTSGDWSQTKPTTAHIVRIGFCTYAHATSGIITVAPLIESATYKKVTNNNNTVTVTSDTINGVVYTGIDTTSKPDGWLPPKNWVKNEIAAMGSGEPLYIADSTDIMQTVRELGDTILVCEGNSITEWTPTAGRINWPHWMANYSKLFYGVDTIYDVATGGDVVSNMVTTYAAQIHPLRPTKRTNNAYFFLMGGTNDIGSSTPATTIFANLKTLYGYAKADGFKVVAFTILPMGSWATPAKDSIRREVNDSIMSNSAGLIDYIVNCDTILGGNTSSDYIDALHPSPSGSQKIAWKTAKALGDFSYPFYTFKQNSTALGFGSQVNSTGPYNVSVGDYALKSNTSGTKLTALGESALKNNTTGIENNANGYWALLNNTTGNYNSAVGTSSLLSNTTGSFNTAYGKSSLFNNNADGNSAMGSWALYANTSGAYNTAGGFQSLFSNTTGGYNVSNGYNSMYTSSTGNYNTSNGYNSMYSNTSGGFNTSTGQNAMYKNTTGGYNTADGSKALYNNTTGNYNVAIGHQALYFNVTGLSNVAVGYNTLSYTTNSWNTAVGDHAMRYNTTGANNVAFGDSAGFYGNFTQCTLIGYRAGRGNLGKGLNQQYQIKIGPNAGANDSLNSRLYIEPSNSSSPLIGGDFNLNKVSINGSIPISTDSALKVTGGIETTGGIKVGKNVQATKLFMSDISDTTGMTATQLPPSQWVKNYVSAYAPGFVSGSFLKAPGVPYQIADTAGVSKTALYYNGTGLRTDTALYISNDGVESSAAITGISKNNLGTFSYSDNAQGSYSWSLNNVGAHILSSYGLYALFVQGGTKYNAVFTDNYRDSVILGTKGEIRINNRSGRKFKADSLGYVYSSVPHVALTRSTDLTITADQNVWYKITGFTTKKNQGLTITGDSVQLTKAGSYHAVVTISFSGLNNEVWEFGLFKAGVLEDPSQLRYTGTTDVGNVTINVTVESDGDDWISFKIRNTSDGDDPTIKRFSASIRAIQLTP